MTPAMIGAVAAGAWFVPLVAAQWLYAREWPPAKRGRVLRDGFVAAVVQRIVDVMAGD